MEGETYDWGGAGFLSAVCDTVRFYRCLLYFLFGGTYKECPYFTSRLQVRTGKPVLEYRLPFTHSITRLAKATLSVVTIVPLMNPQASTASRQRLSCSFGSVITCVRVTDTRWRSTPSSGQMDGQRKGMYGVPRDKPRCSLSRVGGRGAKNSCTHPGHDYVSLLLAQSGGALFFVIAVHARSQFYTPLSPGPRPSTGSPPQRVVPPVIQFTFSCLSFLP